MTEPRFYICRHCGNIIAYVKNSGVKVVCCGEPMRELVPNSVDAAKEKHVPVLEIKGQSVTVRVGETAHPMTAEHRIEWILLHTTAGNMRVELSAGMEPSAVFALDVGERPIAAYAYCNLHGLWKKEL